MWEMAMRMELEDFSYLAFSPVHILVFAKEIPSLPKNIPRGFAEIFKRCISLDPSSRPDFDEIHMQFSQLELQ
jgi:hypothetical protein